MLFVPASMPTSEGQAIPGTCFGAIVETDKIHYTWTDFIVIYVTAPSFNSDPAEVDYIGGSMDSRITITSTNGKQLDFYKLEETDVDTGVFFGSVLLTGYTHDTDGDGKVDPIMIKDGDTGYQANFTGATFGKGPWDGRMQANPGTTVTIKFSETSCGDLRIHDATVNVNWWLSELDLRTYVIKAGEPVTVTVTDPDMSLSVFTRDSLSVNVYSDSDDTVWQLLLTETEQFYEDGTSSIDQVSGIFEGQIIFTDCSPIDQQQNICTPHPSAKVLAKPGDTITAEYNDYTLPFPDFLIGDHLTVAVNAKMAGFKTPTPEPTPEPTTIPAQTQIISDSSFKKYIHDDNRFSIEYPDNWVLGEGHADALAAFDDEYDWRTEVQVFWNDDDTQGNRSDTKVLRGIETSNYELCRDVTFAADDRECSDFKVGDSYIMYTNDNRKVYFVESTYTLVWQNISGSFIINGKEYDLVRTSSYIFDKNGSMEIVTESIGTYQKHSDEIMHMIKSFSLNPTQTSTPTKSVTAIPGWIKNNAEWWADGVIDDSAFLQGIQYLINEKIIVIPPTVTSGSSGSQEVPGWIKMNASWWADGTIDDNTFVSGIQYLVKVGIIQVG